MNAPAPGLLHLTDQRVQSPAAVFRASDDTAMRHDRPSTLIDGSAINGC